LTLDEAIYKRLTDGTGIKVYPVTYPQDATLPVIVYQRTSLVPDYYMGGEAGTADSRYQISAFAATITQARDVAGKIRQALIPWISAQARIDQDLTIAACFMENQFELAGEQEAEALSAFHVLSDYRFLHTDP
jgi:hypothetical protein